MSDYQTPDTPTRADIARANGAKSKGPKTAVGKAITSRNATRHGLRSKQVVLPEESTLSYLALHRCYVEHFRPQTHVELDLVSVMAVTRWRLRRLVAIETNLLGHELKRRREDIAQYVENPDNDKALAWIFDRISGGSSLSLITRYEGSLNRSFDRALKQLQSLQAHTKASTTKRTQQPALNPPDLNSES